jgi:glycosyltransferase involved in cell wall biosynthesis
MRILYHHRTLGDGAEGIHVAEIIKAFRQLQHEVRVISLIGETTNTASKAQSRWTRVARLMPGCVYELGEIAYNLHGYRTLSQAVRDYRPDFIYDRYVSYNYSAVGIGRRYGIPVVLEVNSPYSLQKQTFDETLYFKHVLRLFERKICRDATWVVVVSTPLKKFLVSIGVPHERIVVMPNGTDPDVFHPAIDGEAIRQQYGLDGKIVLGFCGILRPWHGLDLLLQAFEEVMQGRTDVHLLIVGDGPIRAELEGLLDARGLARHVTITGRQPHAKVRSFVAAMDIAVSPRATFYASPMKILEYMGMGKAIVAPDMENIRDILTHEHDGLLFRPEDGGSLAKSLQHLIADVAVRSQLGQAARQKIVAERTWLHNAKDVIRLIDQAVAVS